MTPPPGGPGGSPGRAPAGAPGPSGDPDEAEAPDFTVRLDNFEGPFDLLLQLIARHRLDITEVALSKVTDEFIEHVRVGGEVWDLERTSSFLVVAATLLDLKAARLLPSGEVDDPDDLELLEARDLLFARLMQYRAFKQLGEWMSERMTAEATRAPHPGGVEEAFAALVPEVSLPVDAEGLARMAARILADQAPPTVRLDHLHAPTVNVAEQAHILVARLRPAGALTFRALVADADKITTVGRFLAILELFRRRLVAFEQLAPLAELTIRWTGGDEDPDDIGDEYVSDDDEAPPSPHSQESGVPEEDHD